jgi:hypothetical protein
MHLEKIFEQVRKEDAILWIGSGFSLYAGYPNGQRLSDTIYQSLSVAEKNEIQANLPLMDLAEQYVRLKSGSRNSLNVLLKKEFLRQPSSKKWHEILAKIPHIKTIITTNYDRLFELAYKEDIQTIILPADVAYRDKKTELFKVHGDINHPDTIMITRTDYTDFFHRHHRENLIWTVIKERISNKSIVFIGYDLEDENIKVVLKEITEALGQNRKEMFLIAPGFKQLKIQYLSQLGIQYLDFKGEVFVEKLYENIKDRIATDVSKGDISPETVRKFFLKNNLLVDLKAFEDRYDIQSVRSLTGGNPNTKVSMKFKSDKKFLDSFHDFIKGKRFGQMVIDDNNLEKLRLVLNDINIVDDDISNYQVVLTSKPQKEGEASVVFEDGSEFEGIQYKLFRSKELFEIRASFKKCDFIYQMKIDDVPAEGESASITLNYKQTENFNHVNDAIAVFQLCLNLASGSGATIYPDGDVKGFFLKPEKVNFPLDKLKSNLDFFESIKKVEKLYHVRFTNLGDYSEEDFDNVYKALQFANGGHHIQQWDEELSWDLKKGAPIDLFLKVEEGGQFIVESQDIEELSIYNQKIQLGYQIAEPLELYIVNLEQVKSKETSLLTMKSRSKKVKVYFSDKTKINTEQAGTDVAL